jgi:hypothetical protein
MQQPDHQSLVRESNPTRITVALSVDTFRRSLSRRIGNLLPSNGSGDNVGTRRRAHTSWSMNPNMASYYHGYVRYRTYGGGGREYIGAFAARKKCLKRHHALIALAL